MTIQLVPRDRDDCRELCRMLLPWGRCRLRVQHELDRDAVENPVGVHLVDDPAQHGCDHTEPFGLDRLDDRGVVAHRCLRVVPVGGDDGRVCQQGWIGCYIGRQRFVQVALGFDRFQ